MRAVVYAQRRIPPMIDLVPTRSFLSIYFSCFVHPNDAFREMLSDHRKVRLAVSAVLIPAVGYTLMYLFGWLAGGAPSTLKPWLSIPMEQYFKFDIFIAAPSMFTSWVLCSGVTQLLSRLFSDHGSFEDTVTVVGFGIGVATWASLIHDLSDSVLAVLGVINMREYEALLNGPTFWRVLLWSLYSIYGAWLVFLFSTGHRIAHALKWPQSVFLGFVALIVYQGFFLIFNR